MTLEAPREDLIRMTTTLRSEDEGSTLVGYAAVFNRWTEINSWEGRFKERIAPGAFAKTLRERGAQVKVLFNHGMDPSIGDKPLGKPSRMEEDGKGLAVEVPLDDTSYNADIKALLRSGALDGMSFRMTVIQDEWDKLDGPKGSLPERTIKEVRLHEFGPVTFPAYAATKAGVRAHAPEAFEAWRSANGAQTIAPNEERDEPAGEDATGEDSEPDQTTRASDDATEAAVTPYQPTPRPAPPTHEARRAQRDDVRAMLDKLTRSA